MIIGYARVSTNEQNLDLQIDALTQARCFKIYEEKRSGKDKDRPELNAMLEMLRPGDRVVVWRLDRIGRNMKHLIELADYFEKNQIEFVSIVENIDTSTPTGKLFFHIMAALAEFERNMIIEKTRAGLEAARARGRVGGRQRVDRKTIKRALKLYDSKDYSINDICKMTGISHMTLYRYINERKKEIIKLYESGKSVEDINKKTGVNVSTINRYIKEYNRGSEKEEK